MIDWDLTGKLAYDSFLLVTCAIALWFGGVHERVAAAAAVIASGLSGLVVPLFIRIGAPALYGYTIIDAAVLLTFDQVMVRSRRIWPIAATGIQLAALSIDVAALINFQTFSHYLLIQGKFAYPILFALAVGSLRCRRARAIHRDDPYDRRKSARRD